IESREQLETLRGSDVPIVVQEYLLPDDEEYSVEVYTLQDGRQAGAISYRRDQLIAGDTYKARVAPHPAAEKEACAVVAALGAKGPCNVQLRVTERGPVTFEINPRFSGGVSIRAHFGFNEVEIALRDLVLHQPVPPLKTRSGLARRYWGESYVDEVASPNESKVVVSERAGAMSVFGTSDAAWLSVLARSTQHDFHQLPQYHRVAEQRGEGTAQLFVHEQRGYTIALPLLLRPVDPMQPDGWTDATSVYGYGGPVASHDQLPADVVRNFQAALGHELAQRRVVAVFSRLHPLIEQSEILAGLGESPANGQTISIDLTLSEEEQRAQFNKSCRTTLRKLGQLGFVGLHDREKRYLPAFVSVYLETMKRAGAQSSYFFDRAYFDLLTRELADVSHLFVVLKDGEVAAATICTSCDGVVQDHLGGTRDAFLKFSPDRLIVDTERRWAKAAGARIFHLGGGVGAQEDSVFRYKTGFSNRRHTFRTWRWVLQPEIYAQLCERATRYNGSNGLQAVSSGYFPAYRCPTTTARDDQADIPVERAAQLAGKEGCVDA
ncbi:MAG TPA: GNAT family N-acetyltransferase, partial [Chthoniobacterales bacterium]